MTKKEVPQITSQGVSGDYSNETNSLLNIVDAQEHGIDMWAEARPLQTYEERYPSNEYMNVITAQNIEIIRKIDRTVKNINLLLSRNVRNGVRYERMIGYITFLTYGKK